MGGELATNLPPPPPYEPPPGCLDDRSANNRRDFLGVPSECPVSGCGNKCLPYLNYMGIVDKPTRRESCEGNQQWKRQTAAWEAEVAATQAAEAAQAEAAQRREVTAGTVTVPAACEAGRLVAAHNIQVMTPS